MIVLNVVAGVDTSVIMAIVGHKTTAMFKRYNRIDLDDGIEAIRKFDKYLSGEPKKREIGEEEKVDYFNITSVLPHGTRCNA